MKLVVDDDPERMRKRFCFLVDHEEIMDYGFGINWNAFGGTGAIASVLLFLMRIYVASSARRSGTDARVRVQMHAMQERISAGQEHLQDEPSGPVPKMLPPGEEDVIDAEFTDEPGDGAEEET